MEKRYNDLYDQDIDSYITKKMDGESSLKFEQLMAQDEVLSEEVVFRQGLIKAMKWKRQINIAHTEMLKKKAKPKPILEGVNEPVSEPINVPIRRIGFRRVLAYAASVSILALIGLSWFANNNFSDEQLADNNTRGLISLDDGIFKGGEGTTKDPFEEGLNNLSQEEYAKAATFFEAIPTQNETYVQARLFLAFSQYHTKAYAAAIQNANIVIEKSLDTKDKHKAEWLIIQSQLAQGTRDAAFYTQLKAIVDNPTHTYRKQAVQLQMDLNNFWRKLVF